MIRRLAAILCVAAALCAGTLAAAQEVDPEWPGIVDRAEQLLASPATEDDLTALREDLVGWRARFQTEQSPGSARIDALRAQIAALGPAPEGEATEPPEVVQQRATLQARLEALLAPVRAAEAAFAEADALVAETDRLIEERRARETLRKVASPLNPAVWAPAARAYAG